MTARSLVAVALAGLLAGCNGASNAPPEAWFAAQNGVAPREGNRISVCHGFGCHRKTAFGFSSSDLRRMARLIDNSSPAAERDGIRKMIAWAERRVAPTVGSADDAAGLDIANAGKRGQMDCIDEASNTTSYLMVAARNGLLRHHEVSRPVSRGFFLDGRYPHATAVIVDTDGAAWAVDSWPQGNGEQPDLMPLAQWYAASRAG